MGNISEAAHNRKNWCLEKLVKAISIIVLSENDYLSSIDLLQNLGKKDTILENGSRIAPVLEFPIQKYSLALFIQHIKSEFPQKNEINLTWLFKNFQIDRKISVYKLLNWTVLLINLLLWQSCPKHILLVQYSSFNISTEIKYYSRA